MGVVILATNQAAGPPSRSASRVRGKPSHSRLPPRATDGYNLLAQDIHGNLVRSQLPCGNCRYCSFAKFAAGPMGGARPGAQEIVGILVTPGLVSKPESKLRMRSMPYRSMIAM